MTSGAHPPAELPAWEGAQSALAPAGPGARGIEGLWWQFIAVLGAVFVLVLVATLWALLRRRRPGPDVAPIVTSDRRSHLAIGIATVATTVTLVVLLVASVVTGAVLPGEHDAERSGEAVQALDLQIIGHTWWWEIRYPDADPSRTLVTANELHIPVGVPVHIRLSSHDVIHSFWVPRLHGKRDLVPGYETRTELRADAPGIYRGQCAEFCGAQHAHMSILVVAESKDAFEAWRAARLEPSARPVAGTAQARGESIFLSAGCPLCHAIRGTTAGGQQGPELTHLASQLTLAAGTLPNRVGHLAGWILDPQAVKPGTQMPPTSLSGPELQDLLAYLESLR
jgi:cytochrome c oxidase subunit 2